LTVSAPTGLGQQDVTDLLASQRLHFNHYGRPPMPYACVRASGIEFEVADLAGQTPGATFRVLDASGAYGSACLGAGHPVMRDSVHRALTESGYVTDELASLERARLLTRLFGAQGLWREHFPDDAYHVAGRNSGSEGLELALRLVLESRFDARKLRYHPGQEQRDTILAFEGAWHGWTGGLLQLLNRRHYKVGLPGPATAEDHGVRVVHIPFGDPAALREFFAANAGRLLAVFVEPVQGDAGILVPPPGYLRELEQLCRGAGTLLVADEVLTFAKSGQFFAMRDDGPVHTDITVIGKSLGMGVVSTAMVIARRELRARATGTVATSDLRPFTCAVINDGLDHVVSAGLLERSRELGRRLSAGLSSLVAEFPDVYSETRGIAVMHGLELTDAAAARLDVLRENVIRAGVYIEFMAGAGRRSAGLRYVHPTMRIAPPLVTTTEQAAEIVDRLRAGTRAFRQAR
jgi:acetylornithine/succinyldiaminopimelate/putrescine aminotransferase